jgi:hypothetical protein
MTEIAHRIAGLSAASVGMIGTKMGIVLGDETTTGQAALLHPAGLTPAAAEIVFILETVILVAAAMTVADPGLLRAIIAMKLSPIGAGAPALTAEPCLKAIDSISLAASDPTSRTSKFYCSRKFQGTLSAGSRGLFTREV